jgi:hypothetical protein
VDARERDRVGGSVSVAASVLVVLCAVAQVATAVWHAIEARRLWRERERVRREIDALFAEMRARSDERIRDHERLLRWAGVTTSKELPS